MPIQTPGLAGVVLSFKFTRKRCTRGPKHIFHNGVCLCGHKVKNYDSLYCRKCGKPKTFCKC